MEQGREKTSLTSPAPVLVWVKISQMTKKPERGVMCLALWSCSCLRLVKGGAGRKAGLWEGTGNEILLENPVWFSPWHESSPVKYHAPTWYFSHLPLLVLSPPLRALLSYIKLFFDSAKTLTFQWALSTWHGRMTQITVLRTLEVRGSKVRNWGPVQCCSVVDGSWV